MMDRINKKDLINFQKEAEYLAEQAGLILGEYRGKAIVRNRKSDYLDIVTDADLASEKFLTEEIHKKFPDHNIFAEEHGDELRRSDFSWIIDPLDGTKEYARGIPMYNVSLALEFKDEIIVGVVFRPPTSELFSASKGNGAKLNKQEIHVSQEKNIKNSFICTHLPSYKNTEEESKLTWSIIKDLTKISYRLRPFFEDVASLCWLAKGGLEGFIHSFSGPKWWDVAPGILMVKEAGGKVTNLNGEPIKNRDLSQGIIASNSKIHEELLKIIAKHI